MGGRRRTWWAGLLVVATACSTTERIGPGALANLGDRPPSTRTLVLEDGQGRRIRLDPDSQVRLAYTSGRKSIWMTAADISVTPDARVLFDDLDMALTDVASVEVKNVDGVKTYFLTAGVVLVAAAFIALAVTRKGGASDGGLIAGGTGRAHRVSSPASAKAGVRPADDASAEGRQGSPTKLFTKGAVRRNTIAPLLQAEVGYSPDARTGTGLSVGAGFAAWKMFELSAGFRLYRVDTAVGPPLGYVRAGGNFPFEAADRFGAPIALDVAFGEAGFAHMRVVWGFRWRFRGQAEAALLPVNPRLHRTPGGRVFWDFPSTLQLGYRF